MRDRGQPPQPSAQPSAQPFATEAGAATGHLPAGPPDRRWRLVDRLVAIAFVIGLLVPAGLLAAGKRPPTLENRPLLALPEFSVDAALDARWPAGVDAFLADNVAPRGIAVRLRGELLWRTDGTGNPEVIPGRDGWAFTRGEFEPMCRFTAEEIGSALATGADQFEAAGQDFVFLLVPDKRTVYANRVRSDLAFPPACNEAGRPALRAALATLAPVAVDGVAVLEAARREQADGPDLYYRLDSHWTPSGAIVAIRALVRSIDPLVWRDEDITIEGTHRKTMDLARQIGIRRVEATPKLVVRPSVALDRQDVPVPVDVGNARSVFRIKATGDTPLLEGRTVVVYDSFFGISVPLVAPFFADSTWIHVGDLGNHPELAELLGPFDRVVIERVERGLYQTDIESILAPLVRTDPG